MTKKNISTSKINLVMMVYNEEDIIEKVIRDNYSYISKFPKGTLIVTEDGSTDGTRSLLKKLQKELGFVLHTSPRRKGAAQAHRDELKIASQGADIVLVTDSDGQHDPKDFDKLLNKIDEFDMVVGRKYPRKDPRVRIIGSRVWNMYLNIFFGMRMSDINSGFRAIKKDLLDDILPKNNTFPECVLTELSLRAKHKGYSQTEVNVHHFWRRSIPKAWNPKKIPSIAYKLFKASIKLKKEFLKERSI